ncbi:hypothetical protein ACFFMP_03375 [Pseudoroseomonas cervicalis]
MSRRKAVPPGRRCKATPASVRKAISRASAETRMSGGRTASALNRPAAISGTPPAPALPPQAEPEQAEAEQAEPQPGIGRAGSAARASGDAARHPQHPPPQPISQSGHCSSPSGQASMAASPAGITRKEVSGTATMLAASP